MKKLRALIQSRVRYRVTRGGALFGLALALTGAAAFLSGNNLLFLVFSAMLALLLVSGFLSRLVLSGLELELLLPEQVSARMPSSAQVRIRNLKRLTPSFSIELAGRNDDSAGTPAIMTTPVYFPLIPGRAVNEATIRVTFPRRGRHRENLFAISTRFPFGFLRKTAMIALRHETIVFPSLEEREGSELSLADIAGEIETQYRGAGLDFHRIRPYETTDSSRLVDWKSTAHTGSLQVREFSREQQGAVEIYLDRRIDSTQIRWFEAAVERCAYLVWRLADRDVELHLRAQGFSLAFPSDGEVCALLRYLALVEPIYSAAGGGVDEPADDPAIRVVISAQPEEFENAGWFSAHVIGL